MWLFITLRRVFASVMPLTQPGSCECQTRVWPRIRWPWLRAWLTIWSAEPNVKLLRDGSVASHFISFSGVIIENSRSRIVVYCASLNRKAATAAPKYRPDWPAAAPRVEAAAVACGSVVRAPATARTAAVEPSSRRLRELVGWTMILLSHSDIAVLGALPAGPIQ